MNNCLKCKHHVIDSRLDETKPGVFETNVVHKCGQTDRELKYMLTVREARFASNPCGVEGKLFEEMK